MTARVLLVEDEPDLRSVVEYNLRLAGYGVEAVATAAAALAAARKQPPDLVILDLMLPDFPGTQVCRDLRETAATRDIPVLMLTAKGEDRDRIYGLEVGADDYVAKPVSMRELILRVKALLRRRRENAPDRVSSGAPPDTGERLVAGPFLVDLAAGQARLDGKPLDLSPLEFQLLTNLIERRGRVQTRERLLENVWRVREDVSARTVDTHIKRLRQKLGPAADWIETARGIGYRFRGEE